MDLDYGAPAEEFRAFVRSWLIDHVPAEVCTICGDVLFTPDTVRKIEILRRTIEPPMRTVPLYDFTQAKSA